MLRILVKRHPRHLPVSERDRIDRTKAFRSADATYCAGTPISRTQLRLLANRSADSVHPISAGATPHSSGDTSSDMKRSLCPQLSTPPPHDIATTNPQCAPLLVHDSQALPIRKKVWQFNRRSRTQRRSCRRQCLSVAALPNGGALSPRTRHILTTRPSRRVPLARVSGN
jgi:hypothetical protein